MEVSQCTRTCHQGVVEDDYLDEIYEDIANGSGGTVLTFEDLEEYAGPWDLLSEKIEGVVENGVEDFEVQDCRRYTPDYT